MGLFHDTLADGFEAPHEMFEELANQSLVNNDGRTFYLAEVGGVPVGSGMTAISGDLTGIFNITTLPRHRRRGYGRAVTMAMVRAGYAAGAPTAYLYGMAESVYESAGFGTEEYLTVITAPA